mmetsp:Transcript_39061/g.110467  ORF Transcript_39061/g.110467 Transcript_39061/m.110467 type:complete len:376 (-) Transcript_39061:14-1141(-)
MASPSFDNQGFYGQQGQYATPSPYGAVAYDAGVAWGEDRVGFRIIPLPGVVAEYASVALTTVYLALTFKVAWRGALAPRALQLLPPDSYELTCDPRFLRLISLPRNASKCSIDPFTLALADGQSFPEGNHTFILGVRVPRETPVIAGSSQLGSYFRMLLLEDAEPSPTSMVVDSNMMVEAIPVQSLLLRVQQPTMSWTFSRPSSQPYITFRVNLERSLPAGNFIPFAAVLIQLPEGFSHVITTPADVVNLNTGFPLALVHKTFLELVDFLWTWNMGICRLDSEGVHGWAFPVSIPLEMPVENIWRVSLCGVRLFSRHRSFLCPRHQPCRISAACTAARGGCGRRRRRGGAVLRHGQNLEGLEASRCYPTARRTYM